MGTEREDKWLSWAVKINSMAQIGRTYCKDPFDRQRYDELTQIAYGMMAELATAPLETVAKVFMPESGYATPKVDLRAGVFKDGRILLVRERSDGGWTLPGGWADVLETPTAGVIREVKEESGFDVARPRLVAVIDRSVHPYSPPFPYHIYKMLFLCELQGGASRENIEIDGIDFFDPDELPALSIDRVLERDIRLLQDAHHGKLSEVYVD